MVQYFMIEFVSNCASDKNNNADGLLIKHLVVHSLTGRSQPLHLKKTSVNSMHYCCFYYSDHRYYMLRVLFLEDIHQREM